MTNHHPLIHLIGIGGAGMSAIARVLLGYGLGVSGSDQQRSETTRSLALLGARIFIGHHESHVGEADLVVRSSAVPDHNPEVVAALRKQIPVIKRADFLGALMADRRGIAVAGTHGKTTTTGMIAHILLGLGLDPTVIVGGRLPLLQANGQAGHGPHFVIEADEYDHMFLGLQPKVGIITNVEYDHPDIYPTRANYLAAYGDFVDRLPPSGLLIACADDPGARQLLEQAAGRIERLAYGLDQAPRQRLAPAVMRAGHLAANDAGGSTFDVFLNDEQLGQASIAIPGRHNVANALAALAAAVGEGIEFAAASRSLASFSGMGRRFEIKGQASGITIIDDYAHHPTEIEATLEAARSRFPSHRLWAVWQPHTYSRTRLFLEAFQTCFSLADRVIVLDIYRSRERDTLGLEAEALARSINHPHTDYAQNNSAAVALLKSQLAAGDVVITMNAGDATAIGDTLLAELQEPAGIQNGQYGVNKVNHDKEISMTQEKLTPKPATKNQPVQVDATADQVRRLVEKLKNRAAEEKKSPKGNRA